MNDEQLQYAQSLAENGDYEQALPIWRDLLLSVRKLQPTDPGTIYTCLFGLGECYSETEQFDLAIPILEEAYAIGKKCGAASLHIVESELAWIYNEQGQTLKAIQYFEQAYRIADVNGRLEIDFHLGDMLIDTNFEKAIAHWKKGLELAKSLDNKDQMDLFWQRLVTYCQREQLYQKAINFGLDRISALNDQVESVKAHMELAAVYEAAWQLESALHHIDQAREKMDVFHEEDWQWEQIMLAAQMGNVFTRQQKEEEGEYYYQRALRKAKESETDETLATLYYDIGTNYLALERYERAEIYLEKAMDIGKQAEFDLLYWTVLGQMAAMYHEMGDYHRAITIHQQIMAQEKESDNLYTYGTSLSNLAASYLQLGEVEKTEQVLMQLEQITQELGPLERLVLLRNRAGIYSFWGDHELALSILTEAQETAQKHELLFELPKIETSITECYFALGYYQRAAKILEKLEKQESFNRSPSFLVNMYSIRGMVEDELKNDQTAHHYFHRAIKEVEANGMLVELPTVYNNLAVFLIRIGKRKEALDYLTMALQKDIRLGQQSQISLDHHNLGFLYHEAGDYPRALTHFQKSIETKEKLRRQGTSVSRMSYLEEEFHTYELLVNTLIQLQQETKAFQVLEQYRSQELLQKVSRKAFFQTPVNVSKVQSALPDKSALIAYANSRADSLVIFFITNQNMITKIIPFEHFFKGNFPGAAQIEKYSSSDPFSLSLQKSTEYDANRPVFRMKRHRSQYATRMEALIRYYRKRFQRDPRLWSPRKIARDQEIGHYIYKLLLAPFATELADHQQLFIVPDDILNQLPFDTLVDNQGHYLAETHSLRFYPSASVFLHLQQATPSSKQESVLAIGISNNQPSDNSTSQVKPLSINVIQQLREQIRQTEIPKPEWYSAFGITGWQDLPFAGQEIQSIQEIYPNLEIYLDKNLAPSTVSSWSIEGKLKRYRILHFALHAISLPLVPELSALVLSPDESSRNPYLTMAQIEKLDIHADLTFLSACESGLGRLYSGEGSVGLASAFLAAGSRSVIASLWAVHDKHTAHLVKVFYQYLENRSYEDALVLTKRDCISGKLGLELQKGLYWASFMRWGGVVRYTQNSGLE